MTEPPQDDFKWFGEGFDGFPKRLPEDVVEYIVFIINSKLSDVQTRERLQAFQRALGGLEKKFLREYIWQRESISLNLVREDGIKRPIMRRIKITNINKAHGFSEDAQTMETPSQTSG
jgi:hypothetical protein